MNHHEWCGVDHAEGPCRTVCEDQRCQRWLRLLQYRLDDAIRNERRANDRLEEMKQTMADFRHERDYRD